VDARANERDYAATMNLLIDRNQIVQWAYVGKDYEDRPSVGTVVGAIRNTATPG
jgi:hypothetical protein